MEESTGQGIELCDGGGVLVVEWGAATPLVFPRLKASERAERGPLRVKHPRALLTEPPLSPAAR
jgi:hypothetical protein